MKRRLLHISSWLLLSISSYLPGYVYAATVNGDVAAGLLGWVPSSHNVCGGYFLDPLAAFNNKILPPLATTPVQADADQTDFHQVGHSLLVGNVTLKQPGRWVHADQVQLNRDPTTENVTNATLTGHVILREPGKMMVGDYGFIELQTKVANFFHALYHMAVSSFKPVTSSVHALSAWGAASEIKQLESGIIELYNTTYTTCAPTAGVWQLSAQRVELNRDSGRGSAYNAWLDIKNVPVFYTPYFNFPIDNRRESGFLFPAIGASTNSGFGVSVPYYFNIAPNYDMTFTPHYFAKRGLQLEDLFRYLKPYAAGALNVEVLPHDAAFEEFQEDAIGKYLPGPQLRNLENSSDNRQSLSWQNHTSFSPRWSSTINYNYVSDDYYYQDFSNPSSLAPNQYLRQATLNYAGDHWNFNGLLQGYQTLHPINQAATGNAYTMLPELNLNGNYPNEAHGLNYLFPNQVVYFTRARNPGEIIPPPNTAPPTTARFNTQPGVSWPITGLPGYITPTLQLAATHYDIGNQLAGLSASQQRTLPIFDIDSGLYFDRNVMLGQSEYEQTLEPRLFYLFVPYKNQNSIPLFDSGLVPFSYDSLFLTNRFSGTDRLGDANQVAFSLTTKFLDADTGAEKFHASIGEIYYFRNRRVMLCGPADVIAAVGTTLPCANPVALVGATSPTEVVSPLAGQLGYNFNRSWETTANLAWDPTTHQTINGSWNFHYQPLPNHIINFGYDFVRFGDVATVSPLHPSIPALSHKNDLNQGRVSFAWPLSEKWHAVGSYAYNVSHEYPQTYFYGLEYDNCCWAVRLVSGRTFLALNQNGTPIFNKVIYLQWQLKGLGTVGTSDPSMLLVDSIHGYQDNFQAFEGLKL